MAGVSSEGLHLDHQVAEPAFGSDELADDGAGHRQNGADLHAGKHIRQRARQLDLAEQRPARAAQRFNQIQQIGFDLAEAARRGQQDREETDAEGDQDVGKDSIAEPDDEQRAERHFGIMFSVTNSGSSTRLTSGDQQNNTASITPTSAPSPKAAEDLHRSDGEVGKPSIFRRRQRRERGKRRGKDELRHMEGIDQNLPEHDHGEVHDQDDRQSPRVAPSVAGHHVLPVAPRFPARADWPSLSRPAHLSTIWLI